MIAAQEAANVRAATTRKLHAGKPLLAVRGLSRTKATPRQPELTRSLFVRIPAKSRGSGGPGGALRPLRREHRVHGVVDVAIPEALGLDPHAVALA